MAPGGYKSKDYDDESTDGMSRSTRLFITMNTATESDIVRLTRERDELKKQVARLQLELQRRKNR